MRPAAVTFDSKLDATAWLRAQASDVARGVWGPGEPGHGSRSSLKDYSDTWLANRELKPRTRLLYRELLDALILPGLGDVRLDKMTANTIRNWYATLDARTPTRRAHAYSLLRSIFTTALSDDLVLGSNPCRIRGAGSSRTKRTAKVASLGELDVIVGAMPARYQAMVLLSAWCGLRFGELVELRRHDADLVAGVLRVDRGVTARDGHVWIGEPKSAAGRRTVAIPPHLLPVLASHLREHVAPSPDALLFPAQSGKHLASNTLRRPWAAARAAAGRPDLRFHDLRHTGATLAAATGATLADLMGRMGHSTPAAALRYQHAAGDRDQAIAEALSGFASAKVVPLQRRTGRV